MASNDEELTLDVRIDLYGNQGTRFGINESRRLQGMTFAELAKLLEAFHIIAESARDGRNVNINGQDLRYYRG